MSYRPGRFRLKNNEVAEIDFDESTNNILKDVVFIIGGLVILSFGGKFLVDGAINIAKLMGVSEAVIGLTIVAVGTSLPEMATSILAAAKKMSDIAVGNVVGSNIFNIFCVLGISSEISPLSLGNITLADIVVMLLFTLLVLPLAKSDFILNRKEGGFFLIGYFCYLGWLIT